MQASRAHRRSDPAGLKRIIQQLSFFRSIPAPASAPVLLHRLSRDDFVDEPPSWPPLFRARLSSSPSPLSPHPAEGGGVEDPESTDPSGPLRRHCLLRHGVYVLCCSFVLVFVLFIHSHRPPGPGVVSPTSPSRLFLYYTHQDSWCCLPLLEPYRRSG